MLPCQFIPYALKTNQCIHYQLFTIAFGPAAYNGVSNSSEMKRSSALSPIRRKKNKWSKHFRLMERRAGRRNKSWANRPSSVGYFCRQCSSRQAYTFSRRMSTSFWFLRPRMSKKYIINKIVSNWIKLKYTWIKYDNGLEATHFDSINLEPFHFEAQLREYSIKYWSHASLLRAIPVKRKISS